MESPFRLSPGLEASFKSCPTLCAVREHLSMSQEHSFCDDHNSLSDELLATHLLHRDILHALIVPVTALYARSEALASAALCSSRPSDLELAYREDARSAFLFMQCFLDENEEWCYSRACAACVVHHTLSEEAPLRLAITACLMAIEAAPTPTTSSPPEDDDDDDDAAAARPAPLGSFITALRDAVAEDPFWGSRNWKPLLAKATALHLAFKDLISQASELETLVLSPQRGRSPTSATSSFSSSSSYSSIRTAILTSPTRPSTPGPQYKTFPSTAADFQRAVAKLSRCAAEAAAAAAAQQEQQQQQGSLPNLRPSPLAKQQVRMDSEQRALVHRQAWLVHAALSVPAAERLATRRGRRRYRDEDLWAVEAGRSRSMTA